MPGGREELFSVIIIVRRDSIIRAGQTQPESGPIHDIAVPCKRAAEGMMHHRIPIRSNAGVVTRFVVPLVEQITAGIKTIAETCIIDCGRDARQQAGYERIDGKAFERQQIERSDRARGHSHRAIANCASRFPLK